MGMNRASFPVHVLSSSPYKYRTELACARCCSSVPPRISSPTPAPPTSAVDAIAEPARARRSPISHYLWTRSVLRRHRRVSASSPSCSSSSISAAASNSTELCRLRPPAPRRRSSSADHPKFSFLFGWHHCVTPPPPRYTSRVRTVPRALHRRRRPHHGRLPLRSEPSIEESLPETAVSSYPFYSISRCLPCPLPSSRSRRRGLAEAGHGAAVLLCSGNKQPSRACLGLLLLAC